MENKLDLHQALRAFQKIMDHGRQEDGATFTLKGITAQTDFDGYTVTLKNDYVTLYVLFHSRYDLQYKNTKDLNDFLERLSNIDRTTFH